MINIPSLFVWTVCTLGTEAWSPSTTEGHQASRRQWLGNAAAAAFGGIAIASTGRPADAACLPGDLSADCIGVYKLPYLDARESSWLTDKETLAEFAPDIRFVEVGKLPETLALAREELSSQRKRVGSIREVVFEGDLREAGVRILDLIPKVTAAGMTIRQTVIQKALARNPGASNSKELAGYDGSFQECIAQWNSIDIEIGQALRGQRGVTAVAQIEILTDLKEATAAFDDFLRLVEELV